MQSTFTVNTKEIKYALAAMNRIGQKFTKVSILKIRVLTDTIEISTQGIIKILKAETEGLTDITLPALVLKGYVSTAKGATIQFMFEQGELRCGTAIYTSSAIKLETVFNIPENDLPINATPMDIFRQHLKNNDEETERFSLQPAKTKAQQRLFNKIESALKHLKEYEVTFADLHELIINKIKQKYL